ARLDLRHTLEGRDGEVLERAVVTDRPMCNRHTRQRLRRARWMMDAVLAAGLCAAISVMALPATAQERSLGALRSGAQQIAGGLAQLQRDNRLDPAAQSRLIEQLGQLVLGFIDQSERAAREGLGAQKIAELKPVFEAIAGPLNEIYKAPSARMERQQR